MKTKAFQVFLSKGNGEPTRFALGVVPLWIPGWALAIRLARLASRNKSRALVLGPDDDERCRFANGRKVKP